MGRNLEDLDEYHKYWYETPTTLYAYYGWNDDCLYVGISFTHEMPKRQRHHASTAVWWDITMFCAVIRFPTRMKASVAEEIVVEREKPIYNYIYNKSRHNNRLKPLKRQPRPELTPEEEITAAALTKELNKLGI